MKYKRILLKLSGEALVGDKSGGIDPEILIKYSNEIKKIYDKGVEIAIVMEVEIFIGVLITSIKLIEFKVTIWAC